MVLFNSMKMKYKKSNSFLLILFVVLIFFPIVVGGGEVSAATSGITPKKPVDLEVGIGGFKKVTEGIAQYIGQIYLFATAIVGGLAVVMIIIGAVQYSSSAGNKAAIGSAKETMTSAIIGLVIVLMAYLILGTISGDFVNLTNPRLNVINISNTTPIDPSTYYCAPDPVIPNQYICQRDASGKTPSDSGCTKDTMGLQCAPNRPPADVICSELEATKEGCEEASNYWCKLCELPNGERSCIKESEHCGKSCRDNCMLDHEYSKCLTTNHVCQSACAPLSYTRTEKLGCYCGWGPADMFHCRDLCNGKNEFGNDIWNGPKFDPDQINPDVGQCRCRDNRTVSVKRSLADCEEYKKAWSEKCINEYNCGPGGPRSIGDGYCCTDKSVPSP